MYDDTNHTAHPPPRRTGRLRRAGSVAAGLTASVLLVAACGSGSNAPGVAGAGSSTTAGNAASGGSAKKSALAYSKCMRSHGAPNFPDPNSKGEIAIDGTPENGLGPDSPGFKKALQACKSLEPGPGTVAEQRKNYAQALKFAKCMRSHGVTNLPDPSPPGSGPQTQSHSGPGSSATQGINPDSPVFKRAQQACHSLQPGGAELSTHQDVRGS
jgi:hypothetical protein